MPGFRPKRLTPSSAPSRRENRLDKQLAQREGGMKQRAEKLKRNPAPKGWIKVGFCREGDRVMIEEYDYPVDIIAPLEEGWVFMVDPVRPQQRFKMRPDLIVECLTLERERY